MTSRLVAVSLAVLVLTACSGGQGGDGGSADGKDGKDGKAGKDGSAATGGRVTTRDGAASVELPQGWAEVDAELDGPVVLVAGSTSDEFEQLLVSSFPKKGDAEDAAVFSATGSVDAGGTCKRLADDRTFGMPQLVFDCAFPAQGLHKVFVVQTDGTRSALVLVQTAGRTLADTAGVVTPILGSWRWS